jgi:hypothetical protein
MAYKRYQGNVTDSTLTGCALLAGAVFIAAAALGAFDLGRQRVRESFKRGPDAPPVGEKVGRAVGKFGADFGRGLRQGIRGEDDK